MSDYIAHRGPLDCFALIVLPPKANLYSELEASQPHSITDADRIPAFGILFKRRLSDLFENGAKPGMRSADVCMGSPCLVLIAMRIICFRSSLSGAPSLLASGS
jgi:hypothetical protein